MRRRQFLWGFAALAGLASGPSEAGEINPGKTLLQTLQGSRNRHREIQDLLAGAEQAMAAGERARAHAIAMQLVVYSNEDFNWYTYQPSFQLAVILVQTTDRRDRKAWIFANRGVVECFPGIGGGETRHDWRALCQACADLLTADAAGPAVLKRHERNTTASMLLTAAAFTSGPARTAWAQQARREILQLGSSTLEAWAVDKVTPRFEAAGYALAGDWKTAATKYDRVLSGGIGAMAKTAGGRTMSSMGGLAGLLGGYTTLEAEAASVFAMSGRLEGAVNVLEKARRNTFTVTRGSAQPGLALEQKLTAAGTVIVQPVNSSVGAFALVSVRRKGVLQRHTAWAPEHGGMEPFCRLVHSGRPGFTKDGLISAYQNVRKARGKAGLKRQQGYTARAARDAEDLIGATIRAALVKAKVGPKEDVLIVLPAGLALLPISLARTAGGLTLGQAYQLRFSDSLLAAARSDEQFKAGQKGPASVGILTEDSRTAGLPFLGFEVDVVRKTFAGHDAVYGLDAKTPPSVDRINGVSHAHIANHAAWDYGKPDRSGIALSRKKTATIAEIGALNLSSPPRLIVLSACETGLINVRYDLDQFRGLLTAFLGAGCGGAIGSLWPVDDAAAALLSARFYDEHIRAGRAPAEALKTSQTWMQSATAETLRAYVMAKQSSGQVDDAAAQVMSGHLADLPDGQRPYQDPYFWGGYQLYGR